MNRNKEEWKSISGYNGLYEVSNLGNVRSVDRITIYPNGREWHFRSRILKPIPNTNKQKKPHTSYQRIRLYKNGKWTSFFVHRLVAEAFLPNPKGKKEVNHKDGDRHHNTVDNLEWVTASENALHKIYSLNKSPSNQMELVPVRCIETGKEYPSLSEAARAIGVTASSLWCSVENGGKTQGFHFERIKNE